MNGGSISGQSRSFRDFREICRRADILMLDDQARADVSGFTAMQMMGGVIHGMLGWDKLIPESMAMYQGMRSIFRLSSKPEPGPGVDDRRHSRRHPARWHIGKRPTMKTGGCFTTLKLFFSGIRQRGIFDPQAARWLP